MIYVIRDKQVMLDSDLAVLYQIETGALNRAVKRNIQANAPESCKSAPDSDQVDCERTADV